MIEPPGDKKSPDAGANQASGQNVLNNSYKQNIDPNDSGRKGFTPRGQAARRLGEDRRVMGDPDRARDLGCWRVFGFLQGNALAQFRPGFYSEGGVRRAGRWPDLTVESALGPKNSPARLAIEALVDEHGAYIKDKILDAISEGLTAGQKWTAGKRKLISATEAAKRLGVDLEEREELGLRSIGAVDCPKHILELEARNRKRARDRERIAEKRRAAGIPTRQEFVSASVTRSAPWKALGISRSTYYARLKTANSQARTGVSPHLRDTTYLLNHSEATDLSDHRLEGTSSLSKGESFPSFELFRGSGTPARTVTTEWECGHDQRRRSAPKVSDPRILESIPEIDTVIGATGAMLHKQAGQIVFRFRATR